MSQMSLVTHNAKGEMREISGLARMAKIFFSDSPCKLGGEFFRGAH